MKTILGAGGTTANALTKELLFHNPNEQIRLVSRRPVNTTGANVTWTKADLLNYAEVLVTVKGSTIIYMCAGLVYDKKIWQEQWPVVMQNLINASKETQARLIFFDNVYMYGLVKGPMLETTPYNPVSTKGEVRARIATQLMDEVKAGNIQATIARAADFYGTDTKNSFIDMMVLDKYANKQSAQWIGDPKVVHNFTYIPDTGKALYLLGQNEQSGNQIWHLPTAAPISGKEFITLAANIYEVKPAYSSVNKLMLQMVGLFKKVVAGTVEMYYQFDHDYDFNSSKFENAFQVKPTSYEDGLKNLSETLYRIK